MITTVSENTKAILLLTAPLLLGASQSRQYDLLKPKEYQQFAAHLVKLKKQPADLLSEQVEEILNSYDKLDSSRILPLLSRGLLLSQVINHWQSQGIWVVSRADEFYPKRLKERLKENSPAILYGCGDINLLNYGGLAIVGSRNVDDKLIAYTQKISELASNANKMIISGGAKGVDSAAMYGALQSNGWGCGVLADGLEEAALRYDNRLALQNGRLVLISAVDPKARFNTGSAMQRNKYIYALADAALIVNSDENKGGTWAGAIEQLDKYRQIPLYIRSTGNYSAGLDALKHKGALLWSNPHNIDEFDKIFEFEPVNLTYSCATASIQMSFLDNLTVNENVESEKDNHINADDINLETEKIEAISPSTQLFNYIGELIRNLTLNSSRKESELAEELGVSNSQMKLWLKRLVGEELMIKENRPVKYRWKEQ